MIKAAIQSAIGNKNNAVTIGEYKGFKLDVYTDSAGKVNLYIKGKSSVSIIMSESEGGNITKINNALNNIEDRIVRCKDRIEALKTAKAAQIIAIKAVIINKLIFFISIPPYLYELIISCYQL